jgi:hypothetical protein
MLIPEFPENVSLLAINCAPITPTPLPPLKVTVELGK